MNRADRIVSLLGFAGDIIELGGRVVRAVTSGDLARAEALLPAELRISTERRLAEDRLRDKFPGA